MTKWFIEKTLDIVNDYPKIIEAIQELDLDVTWVTPRDYMGSVVKYDGPCVELGTCSFLNHTRTRRLFYGIDEFKCSTYMGRFTGHSNHFLNNGTWVIVKHLLEYFPSYLPKPMFCRPDIGTKPFTGKVIEPNRSLRPWEKQAEDLHRQLDFCDPSIMVLLSQPFPIDAEYRIWCDAERGRAITGSTYRVDGKINYKILDPNDPAMVYAETVLIDYYHPAPVFCIDLAQLPDENCEGYDTNLFILEYSSASCAGMYGADVKAIMQTMSEIAEEEW